MTAPKRKETKKSMSFVHSLCSSTSRSRPWSVHSVHAIHASTLCMHSRGADAGGTARASAHLVHHVLLLLQLLQNLLLLRVHAIGGRGGYLLPELVPDLNRDVAAVLAVEPLQELLVSRSEPLQDLLMPRSEPLEELPLRDVRRLLRLHRKVVGNVSLAGGALRQMLLLLLLDSVVRKLLHLPRDAEVV